MTDDHEEVPVIPGSPQGPEGIPEPPPLPDVDADTPSVARDRLILETRLSALLRETIGKSNQGLYKLRLAALGLLAANRRILEDLQASLPLFEQCGEGTQAAADVAADNPPRHFAIFHAGEIAGIASSECALLEDFIMRLQGTHALLKEVITNGAEAERRIVMTAAEQVKREQDDIEARERVTE